MSLNFHSVIGDYEVYKSTYLYNGRNAWEYTAYKKGSNKSELYKISRPSLKSLKKEIFA